MAHARPCAGIDPASPKIPLFQSQAAGGRDTSSEAVTSGGRRTLKDEVTCVQNSLRPFFVRRTINGQASFIRFGSAGIWPLQTRVHSVSAIGMSIALRLLV